MGPRVKVVILQPSYIPWRGYFHQLYRADLFVFYDDVQYDRHGWRNRNRIKTANGPRWLTIPLRSTGGRLRETAINGMVISGEGDWARKHFETIRHAYARAPYFETYRPMIENWFGKSDTSLAEFTVSTTLDLARALGIDRPQTVRSSLLGCPGNDKTGRLLAILKHVGATGYLSGPAARDYLDVAQLEAAGIKVEWMVYDYPEYPQLYPPFDGHLSALDLLLNTGTEAGRYIWRA